MSDYLDVSIHTSREWVAFGHNTQRGMVCKNSILKKGSPKGVAKKLRWKHGRVLFINMDSIVDVYLKISHNFPTLSLSVIVKSCF